VTVNSLSAGCRVQGGGKSLEGFVFAQERSGGRKTPYLGGRQILIQREERWTSVTSSIKGSRRGGKGCSLVLQGERGEKRGTSLSRR